KPRWGGFYGSDLATNLQAAGADTLVVCGLSLHGGVETTVRDAYNRDLQSVVGEGGCLTRALPHHGQGEGRWDEGRKVTWTILAQRFARVATTSEICDELRQWAP